MRFFELLCQHFLLVSYDAQAVCMLLLHLLYLIDKLFISASHGSQLVFQQLILLGKILCHGILGLQRLDSSLERFDLHRLVCEPLQYLTLARLRLLHDV